MLAGLWAFMSDVASQAGDANPSRAPGLTSGSLAELLVLEYPLWFTIAYATVMMLTPQ